MSKTTEKTIPVTVLKRLGAQAPEFDLPVTFKRLDGAEVQVKLHCKALRKTEWAKAKDDRQVEYLRSIYEPVLAASSAAQTTQSEASEDQAPAPQADPAAALAAALEAQRTQGQETGVRKVLADDVDLVMAFAVGWELEDDFTTGNLQALGDEFGGAIKAILDAYDAAIFHGRMGN
jgi:hypothetical protein